MVLSGKAKAILRSKFSEIKMLIIDEISMASRDLFYKSDARLSEIFYLPHLLHSQVSYHLLGDFLQLLSVRGKPIYALVDNHKIIKSFLNLDLWNIFKFTESIEVMRQKGDTVFTEFVNKVRVWNLHE